MKTFIDKPSFFTISFPPLGRGKIRECRQLEQQLKGLLMRTPNRFKTRQAAEMVLANLRLQGLDSRAYVAETFDVM